MSYSVFIPFPFISLFVWKLWLFVAVWRRFPVLVPFQIATSRRSLNCICASFCGSLAVPLRESFRIPDTLRILRGIQLNACRNSDTVQLFFLVRRTRSRDTSFVKPFRLNFPANDPSVFQDQPDIVSDRPQLPLVHVPLNVRHFKIQLLNPF